MVSDLFLDRSDLVSSDWIPVLNNAVARMRYDRLPEIVTGIVSLYGMALTDDEKSEMHRVLLSDLREGRLSEKGLADACYDARVSLDAAIREIYLSRCGELASRWIDEAEGLGLMGTVHFYPNNGSRKYACGLDFEDLPIDDSGIKDEYIFLEKSLSAVNYLRSAKEIGMPDSVVCRGCLPAALDAYCALALDCFDRFLGTDTPNGGLAKITTPEEFALAREGLSQGRMPFFTNMSGRMAGLEDNRCDRDCDVPDGGVPDGM